MVWGTMVREPLPGLTAVLAAQILVGMARPPRPRQAAALVAVIAATAGAAFAVSAVFSDRLLILMAALGLLFFIGFAMRERAAGRPSLPATMLLNATAVVPVLTVQANILGAGVIETLVGAAIRATVVVWLLYAIFPAPQEETTASVLAGAAPASGTSVTEQGGVARTLAKVAIVLPARVESLGWGVGEGDVDPTTGLPKTHQGAGGWLASAQRFPVDLAFETADGPPRGVRYNARASVIFYTGEHPVFDALAWLWIRLISVLTFVS